MVIGTLLTRFILIFFFTISLNENKWHLQFLFVSEQLYFLDYNLLFCFQNQNTFLQLDTLS